MFCTQCGQALTPAARFCAACGAAVKPEIPAVAPPPAWTPPLPPTVPPTVGVYPMGHPEPGTASHSAFPTPLPTQDPLVNYAGFWRRWWGLFIDRMILSALLLPIGLALGINFFWPFGTTDHIGADWYQIFIGSLSMVLVRSFADWVYFAVFHSASRQATPGQMLFGIHVTGLDGGRIGLGRASGRYFASWISGFTLSIGYIMGAFTERRQTLHDMIAGTLVVRGRPNRP